MQRFTPTPMGRLPFYTYVLAYPKGFIDENGEDLSDIVFYVGKGSVQTVPPQRVDIHEFEAMFPPERQVNRRKCQVIRQVIDAGMGIQKRIIFESFSHRDVLDHEKARINTYAGPHLTNARRERKPQDSVTARRIREQLFTALEASRFLGITSSLFLTCAQRNPEEYGMVVLPLNGQAYYRKDRIRRLKQFTSQKDHPL